MRVKVHFTFDLRSSENFVVKYTDYPVLITSFSLESKIIRKCVNF